MKEPGMIVVSVVVLYASTYDLKVNVAFNLRFKSWITLTYFTVLMQNCA
jgi:hypothetical protein